MEVFLPRTLEEALETKAEHPEAVPRFPPTVPRFRICGEPTVRAIWTNGPNAWSSPIMRAYVTPAPRNMRPSS